MSITVGQLITDAMGLCGATEIDETPSTGDFSIGLRALNVMLDRWSARRMLVRSTTPILFTATANKASYTIGPVAADVTAGKPINIRSAFITDANIDYPMSYVDQSIYNGFPDKNVSFSRPEYFAYDPGAEQQSQQKGTLYLYYTPDKNYSIKLECDSYITELTSTATTMTFEPAYYEALTYNLALRLFRRYHKPETPVPQDLVMIAHDSLRTIETMNNTQYTAGLELPGKITKYNVYTDQ